MNQVSAVKTERSGDFMNSSEIGMVNAADVEMRGRQEVHSWLPADMAAFLWQRSKGMSRLAYVDM